MKNIFLLSIMIFSLNAFAEIDPREPAAKPSASQIASNHACFSDLELLGCGDPGEDIEHFRSCMNNVYSTLAPSCQTLMKDLYRTR